MELCYLPAIYLGPNYGGCNEDNGDLPQKIPCMYCYSPCPQPCSRPPPTHTFTRDSRTPRGKSPVGVYTLNVIHYHWMLIAYWHWEKIQWTWKYNREVMQSEKLLKMNLRSNICGTVSKTCFGGIPQENEAKIFLENQYLKNMYIGS